MVTDKLIRIKDYLSLNYDIEIEDITPVKNVMRICTKQGDKCLKRVKYRKEDFLFILSAMKHLLDNGFDGVVPFIPASSGELYVKLEDGYGFLTDWVQSRECDYSNPLELRMAAGTLARLHVSSRDFVPMEGAAPRLGWGKWVEKFLSRLEDIRTFKKVIEGKEKLTPFDCLFNENLAYFLDQGIKAVGHLEETGYYRLMEEERAKKTFCHHDYAHHNVLISNDFRVYIIDFDYCICDTRIHDLSSLIIRNMRHGNWSMDKAQYIMDCYMEEGTVDAEEIPVINAFMEFPQDFWQVGLQYYVEKQKWTDENFYKRLNSVISDRDDRQLFLDEFRFSIEI
jgi:CotS family spore coat protein